MSKDKKEKKPMDSNLKNTIIKSVAAVVCSAIACGAISSAMGSIAEADKALASIKPSYTGTISVGSSDAGSNTDTSAPADSTPAGENTETGGDTSSSADYNVDNGSTDSTPSTPADTDSTDKGSAEKSDVPQSKAEIVSYCNNALNNAKASKVGYTKTFVRKGGDNLPSVVAKVIAQNKTTTAKKGSDDIKDDFPAAGYSWSSKLRESDVESATLKQNGQYYEITLKLGTETNPAKGEASKYGRVMSVIDANDAKDMLPGIKTINMVYHDGYVYVKVDSKTGRLVKAEFSAAANISASIAVIGDLKADNLISTETFTDFQY